MYASGHKVPVSGQIRDDYPVSGYPSEAVIHRVAAIRQGAAISGGGYPSGGCQHIHRVAAIHPRQHSAPAWHTPAASAAQ